MVLAAQGLSVAEATIAAEWSGSVRGFALSDAASRLHAEHLTVDPDSAKTYEWLRAQLGTGWAIAQVFSSVLAEVDLLRTPVPISPHGQLSQGHLGQLHAIVLVDCDDRGYYYLDPFYLRDGQPLFLPNHPFVRAFQGDVVIVALNLADE